MSDKPVRTDQEIQAYFSHSYRADDREVNLFFWKLFSEEGFFFTIDPKSDKVIVPHLERMMRYSDCFIAVVTRRLETLYEIGDITLPQPQVIWTYSPYIALENYLAELAEKPRLIYVENGLDANRFGDNRNVHIFERTTLEKREKQFGETVHNFAEKTRAYIGYEDRVVKSTGKAGILIENPKGYNDYDEQIVSDIKLALRVGGYSTKFISPYFSRTQEFIREIKDLELIVTELNTPYTTYEALAFIQAKAIPCIRIAKLNAKQTKSDLDLPTLLNDYKIGDIEPVIAWKKKEDLVLEILLYLSKFQQTRTLLDTYDRGRHYFLSAGRKPAKVFISNPHSLNALALALVEGFQTVNIQFFQYQSSMRIGGAWQEQLDRELQEFDIFVALINDDYHSSEWCQLEMRTAFERWKKKEVEVLPYIVGKTRLPELIKEHIQCAFVQDETPQDVVQHIVSTIDEYLINQEKEAKGNLNDTLRREIYGSGNKWAVIVGVDYYDDSLHYPPLHVCVKDAIAIKETLRKSGYTNERMQSLTDQDQELPTRENILVTLKSMADATEPDDLLLFYYSGHGDQRGGESYLVARNGRNIMIQDTAVSMSKIKDIMKSASARAKVLIIDACHSGADFSGKGPVKMTEEFIQRVFQESKGLAVLASCEQGQLSYEWRQNERSVFTHYFLEALKGEADFDDKGFITIQDVNRHVTSGVKLWASQHGYTQTPTLQCEISGDVIIAHLS